jgi:hypothetical protein
VEGPGASSRGARGAFVAQSHKLRRTGDPDTFGDVVRIDETAEHELRRDVTCDREERPAALPLGVFVVALRTHEPTHVNVARPAEPNCAGNVAKSAADLGDRHRPLVEVYERGHETFVVARGYRHHECECRPNDDPKVCRLCQKVSLWL